MKKTFLLFLLTLLGCSKEQLELTNPNEVEETNFWKTETDALRGVLGVYDAFQSNELAGDRYYRLDVATDNLGTNTNADFWLDIKNFAANGSNGRITGIWRALYTGVNRANLAIEKIAQMPTGMISDAARTRLLAEAKFLRAYAYHDLVALYQGVPFYTQPNLTRSEGVAATQGSVVANAMIADLNGDVLAGLPVSTSDGRVSKGAALALLGKFYMAQKDYAKAAQTLKLLKAAPYSYALHPNYAQLFTPEVEFSNKEAIFQISFVDNQLDQGETFSYKVDTTTAPSVTPFGVPRTSYQVGANLRDSYLYTDGKPLANHPIYGTRSPLVNTTSHAIGRDPRFRATIFSNQDVTGSGKRLWNFTGNNVAVKKYFFISPIVFINRPQNYHLIRYADVLLMLAEAELELNPADPDIFANVEAIRKRAGIAMFTAADWAKLTTDQKREAIRDERRWEFAFEHVRFFDFRRWGVDYTKLKLRVTNPLIPASTPDVAFVQWPYPQVELDNNPALKAQGTNPGF
jgi:starch-binding outer membrane protein, SusD/RagB family